MPIRVKESGFDTVTVESADGGERTVKLNMYLVGCHIAESAKEWKAAEEPESMWVKRLTAIFEEHGVPGLSGQACLDLAQQILDWKGEYEGKPSATQPPESELKSPNSTDSTQTPSDR